jgi:DNA polymerase III alpha subunit
MVRVISCEYVGEEQTYDLEVGHEDHQFYTSSGFLTSNSHSACYAFNSYHCAWLYTYYENEWIKACLECDPNPEETLNTVRALGYEVQKPSVNNSEVDEWNVMSDKTCVPAFNSLKGVGLTGARELVKERPPRKFRDLHDFFFDGDYWRYSKLNKKALTALIRMEAFDSLDCVGPGKLFKNYAHMENTIFGETTKMGRQKKYVTYQNFDLIKKKKATFEELALDADDNDWPTTQKIQHQKEIVGFYDKGLIVGEFMPTFREFDIESIDQAADEQNKDRVWALVENVKEKMTKNGKPFLTVQVSGMTEKPYNFRVWNESLQTTKHWIEGNVLVFSLNFDKDWGYNVPRNSKILKVNK